MQVPGEGTNLGDESGLHSQQPFPTPPPPPLSLVCETVPDTPAPARGFQSSRFVQQSSAMSLFKATRKKEAEARQRNAKNGPARTCQILVPSAPPTAKPCQGQKTQDAQNMWRKRKKGKKKGPPPKLAVSGFGFLSPPPTVNPGTRGFVNKSACVRAFMLDYQKPKRPAIYHPTKAICAHYTKPQKKKNKNN